MTQELDALLARVDEAALRADLARHIERVKAQRQFGLVFENLLPETVRLRSQPVRRAGPEGSKPVIDRGSPRT